MVTTSPSSSISTLGAAGRGVGMMVLITIGGRGIVRCAPIGLVGVIGIEVAIRTGLAGVDGVDGVDGVANPVHMKVLACACASSM
jgi:hypothetical protein